MLLAAVDRAVRHGSIEGRRAGYAHFSEIAAHLGLDWRVATARRVRLLDQLEEAGLLASIRPHYSRLWRLTPAGQRRLRKMMKRGEVEELPEAPQHRLWREAHDGAAAVDAKLREELRAVLEGARAMLDASDVVSSERWLALGEDLDNACLRIASVTYCLHEWAEPDDSYNDRVTSSAQLKKRRSTRLIGLYNMRYSWRRPEVAPTHAWRDG